MGGATRQAGRKLGELPTSCPEQQGLAVATTKRKAQVVLSWRAQSLKAHPPRLLTSLDPVPQIPKGQSEQLTHAP